MKSLPFCIVMIKAILKFTAECIIVTDKKDSVQKL